MRSIALPKQPLTYCLTTIAVLTLAGCANLPGQSDRYSGRVIDSSDAEGVTRHCKLLNTLSGTSGLVGLFAPKGVDNIKQTLLRQADAMGATHVVWDKPMAGYENTTLSGRAYECPANALSRPQ